MRLLSSHALVSTLGLALLCLIAWLGLTCGILSNSITEQIVPVTEVKIPFWPATIPIASGPAVPVTTPLVQRVNPWVYAAPTLNLFALGFFMLSLSVLFSCFDRYRWRTIGLVVGLYVVQLLLFILSKSTEATAACGYGTILSAYQPDAIIQFSRDNLQQAWWLSVPVDRRTASWQFALGPLGLSSLLLALAVLCYAGAAYRFHRRDLPAPL
jgi:ABC-2 type transport system permease protein